MLKIIEIYNDKLAEKYDEATLKFKWRAAKVAQEILRKERLIKDNSKILDLGIGTGQCIDLFLDKNCKIYGVDISRKMLELAKQRYSELKVFKWDISQELRELGFREKYFDLVITIGVLEFIKNIKKIIREIKQLLKNGGHLIFTYELLIPDYKFQNKRVQYNAEGYIKNSPKIMRFKLYRRSKKEINKLLKEVGYQIVRHFKIRAFLKGPAKIPVYYGLVLATLARKRN